MPDPSTALKAALTRAVNRQIDGIAKTGLQSLKGILDKAGFAKSEYLKDYTVQAHVQGQSIKFQIQLRAEAVQPVDKVAEQTMKDQAESLANKKQASEIAQKVYGLTERGPQLILGSRDALKPASNALKPAESAKKTSEDRSIGHQIAAQNPRSMNVNKDGKLSISFRQSTKTDKNGDMIMPRGKMSGIPHQFVQGLKGTVAKHLSSELATIFKNRT